MQFLKTKKSTTKKFRVNKKQPPQQETKPNRTDYFEIPESHMRRTEKNTQPETTQRDQPIIIMMKYSARKHF